MGNGGGVGERLLTERLKYSQTALTQASLDANDKNRIY